MSRGFVKEDDQEQAPIIPPRAALPIGVTNYVTPAGIKALRSERAALEKQITTLSETDDRERRQALALLNGKLNLLKERIVSARVLDHVENNNEVRFGAEVVYKITNAPSEVRIKIVGVDEANIKENKIAFTAPLARAINGKKAGEKAVLNMGADNRTIKIIAINYPQTG